MRTFEIMVEDGERVVVTKNVEVKVVGNYEPPDMGAGYDVVQISTESHEDIIKIDENGFAWKMADCLDNGNSSFTGKEIWSSEFWEQCRPTIREQLLILGMKHDELDNHCSDLYVKKNDISESFIKTLEGDIKTFKDNIAGELWYDIPFAYSEYFVERNK